MKKIRCAVIGAGWWGTEAHLPALRDHPKASIVAVQHHLKDQAHRIADDFKAEHACTEAEQVFAINDLDAVIISSIPKLHFDQARVALERGLHVLIEKPMTLTVNESKELIELGDRKNLHFLISCPWHYTDHSIEARQLIRRGALGSIKMISVLMTNFTMGLYRGLPWHDVFADNSTLQSSANPYQKPGLTSYSDPSLSGGGQIYCQVSHAAAYLGFLTGSPPVEVFARFDNANINVDVYDILNIKLANGALVNLTSTGATMLSQRHYEVRIYGDDGMILMELWKGTMEYHDLKSNVIRYPDLAPKEIYPLYAPANNLIDVIANNASNGSPAEHGVYAMSIIEAACQSVKTGQNVLLVA